MALANYEPLWYWVTERERIRICKERGEPQPWTSDSILQTYRFCCVRREDDRVTIWVRDNIRKPYADHPLLWLMLCCARQINWPETLAELIAERAWPSNPKFEPQQITDVLDTRKARGDKVYTGAYMISAPTIKGMSKNAYIAETVLGELWRRRESFPPSHTLHRTHAWLTMTSGWGPFMAYQAVVDMRFTRILQDATDVGTWAAAGPGTIRGLNRLHGRSVDAVLSQAHALREMQAIYPQVLSVTGIHVDFSDVPNMLCETDKYLRVKLGEGKPRALYVAGRGA